MNIKLLSREFHELVHYHRLHCMDQIRGRMDLYLIALMIQSYYRDRERYAALDEDGREILAYLDSEQFYADQLSRRVYPPHPFMTSRSNAPHDALFAYTGHLAREAGEIHTDDSGDCFAYFNGHKIFVGTNAQAAQQYWIGLLREQDPRHPHCYCDEEGGFSVEHGDVIVDVGAAEGFFTMMYIDKIRHAYLFESSDYWYPLLEKTFAPHRDKITLIKGFAGDSAGQILLDDFFRDKQKPNFVKMDVEGAEALILRGMDGLLRDRNLQMKLAVCAYHRQEDEPWIRNFLGETFDIQHSKSYYWHMPDPMPPFLRRGVLRIEKKTIPRMQMKNSGTPARNCPTPVGCMDQLGREITISDKVQICCSQRPKDPEYFLIDCANIKEGIEESINRIQTLRKQHKRGIPGPCEGCYRLTDDPQKFAVTGEPMSVLISSGGLNGFKGDICNVDCCYCGLHDFYKANPFSANLFDAVRQAIEIYHGKKLHIIFANGEFLARSDAETILRHLLKKDVLVSLTTNGSLWSAAFGELIKSGKAGSINISLDSGTRETYIKVKRRDFFERVLENLKRYSEHGIPIDLKYIMLPDINMNEADFRGFIDAAKSVNIREFRIAANTQTREATLSDDARDKILHFIQLATEAGFAPRVFYDYFNRSDAEFIQKTLDIKQE